MKAIDIAGRAVGPDHPCFVIAEAGVNHNGDVDMALHMVDAAAEAGADAVKFQTFRAAALAAPDAPKADYQLQTTDPGETQHEMLRRLELPREAYRGLMARCVERGILFISTPFDEESADFLDGLGVAVFKTPSPEIVNTPYLRYVAGKGKPMIVSTGTATMDEVEAAVGAIQDAGNRSYVLLHCVSSYPADPADANLRAMRTMTDAFDAPVGYSDHTLGTDVALAAVALGACVIEKHFTLDRSLPGPDHRASLEPGELTRLTRGVKAVEASLGDGNKRPMASEASTALAMRKSLVAAGDIAAGSVVTEAMVGARRPGTGLSPAMRDSFVGRRARQDIAAGAPLALEMVE